MNPELDLEQALETIKELEEQLEHLNDLNYELEQNLFAAQDQNHYFVLLGEYRDKNFLLETKVTKLENQLACSVDSEVYTTLQFASDATIKSLEAKIEKLEQEIYFLKEND